MCHRYFRLAIISIALSGRHAAAATPVEPAVAKAGVMARFEAIRAVETKYQCIYSLYPVPTAPPDAIRGDVGREMNFTYLQGLARVDWKLTPQSLSEQRALGPAAELAEASIVFGGNRVETTGRRIDSEDWHGVVYETGFSIPDEVCVDLILGLRCWHKDGFMTKDDLKALTVDSDAHGKVTATLKTDQQRTHRWTFDPDRGYAIERYEYMGGGAARATEEVVAYDFQKVGTLDLPRLVKQWSYARGTSDYVVTRQIVLHDVRYTLDGPTNVPDRYVLRYHAGTFSADDRTGLSMRTGPTTGPIDDEKLHELATERLQKRRGTIGK